VAGVQGVKTRGAGAKSNVWEGFRKEGRVGAQITGGRELPQSAAEGAPTIGVAGRAALKGKGGTPVTDEQLKLWGSHNMTCHEMKYPARVQDMHSYEERGHIQHESGTSH